MSGLGLSGPPTPYSLAYLKGNIEGGEKFDWWYADGVNAGPGLDPNGSDLTVSLPQGDRLSQTRSAYAPNQQPLANKQFRWWWRNTHQAVYDTGDGQGWIPHGPQRMARAVEAARFIEYGYPSTRQGDEPAERVLRRQIDRERDALLVDLAAGSGRRLRAAARRYDREPRAPGDVRVLDQRRPQRDLGRRRSP